MLAFHGYCGVVFACSEESTLIITFSITGRVYSMLSLYVYFETLSACSRESTLITDQIAGIVYCFYHALVHVYFGPIFPCKESTHFILTITENKVNGSKLKDNFPPYVFWQPFCLQWLNYTDHIYWTFNDLPLSVCTRKDCFRAPAHLDYLNLDIPKAMVSKIRCMYRCPYHRGKDEQVLFFVCLYLCSADFVNNKIVQWCIEQFKIIV